MRKERSQSKKIFRREIFSVNRFAVDNALAAQKEGFQRGEHPFGTSLPPFFVKRKEGPCRGLSDESKNIARLTKYA